MTIMLTISLTNTTTLRTTLRRKRRINLQNRRTSRHSLIRQELLQLIKCPRTQITTPLRRTLRQQLLVKADTRQVLQNEQRASLILINECLRQPMINISHPTVLSPIPRLPATRADFLPLTTPSGNDRLIAAPATPSQFAMFLPADRAPTHIASSRRIVRLRPHLLSVHAYCPSRYCGGSTVSSHGSARGGEGELDIPVRRGSARLPMVPA